MNMLCFYTAPDNTHLPMIGQHSQEKAIMNSLLASKACDITGIVSIACARHGCYALNALVDLFKGEQQKNVDFAFLKALKSTNVELEQGTLLIYDIACQYFMIISTPKFHSDFRWRQPLDSFTSMHTRTSVSFGMQHHLFRVPVS